MLLSYQINGTLKVPNRQATVKIVWSVIKNTSAVSPWNSVTQSKRLGGFASSHLGLMCDEPRLQSSNRSSVNHEIKAARVNPQSLAAPVGALLASPPPCSRAFSWSPLFLAPLPSSIPLGHGSRRVGVYCNKRDWREEVGLKNPFLHFCQISFSYVIFSLCS